ncbi:MAG TPA: transglutaminase family protein [Xanthobacteraceae bacterium]|nr:transglutaminase family protein [Xanthobacteraceae bacterium]
MDEYLAAGTYIDSDSPQVAEFAREAAARAVGEVARVQRLFHAVRDGIRYDPYIDFADPTNYRASGVLAARRGFCVGKAALLAAACRAIGIPARVGYADVRNHMTSPRLYALIKTDVFIWHSYADIRLADRWVKATPAFDRALCERVGIAPLDFDGQSDSLFHPFDRAGRRHMEYLADRGTFADVPFETMQAGFRAFYPGLAGEAGVTGDFHAEAVAGGD